MKSNNTNDEIEDGTKAMEVQSGLRKEGNDISICSRLKYELTTDMLEEPDGSIVDVEHAFAPEPVRRTSLIRGGLVALNMAIFVWDMVYESVDQYYLIYLTRWTVVLSIAYLIASFLCAALPRSEVFEDADQRAQPRLITKIAWELYALNAPAGLTVIVMYWLAIYDGRPIIFLNLWRHGLLAACVIFDGLWIGSVPIRSKQMRNIIVYEFLFLLWSIIHIFAGIGNGDDEKGDDDEESDDAIYGVLNWKVRPETAVFISILVVSIVTPLMFFICWISYLKFSRRKVIGDNGSSL